MHSVMVDCDVQISGSRICSSRISPVRQFPSHAVYKLGLLTFLQMDFPQSLDEDRGLMGSALDCAEREPTGCTHRLELFLVDLGPASGLCTMP
jgi:hypothetical protein